MSVALLTLTFQGEPTVSGALDGEELRECQREAFPRSPRRDAATNADYRSFKLAPLRSGRLLLSTVCNRSETDVHGRAALRAMGCVIDRDAASGPARDLTAVWSSLTSWTPAISMDEFMTAVTKTSALENDQLFTDLHERFTADAPFYAAAASALTKRQVNLLLSPGEDVVHLLRPVLLLLPASRLFRLELATGSVDSDTREATLGFIGSNNNHGEESSGGLLGNLLRRRQGGAASIDFRAKLVTGADEGPIDLVSAVIDTAAWGHIPPRERFRLLLRTLDSQWVGGRQLTPFDLAPELDEMRRTVQRIEGLSKKLEGWR
jgi:hypothetical protein